MFQQWLKGILTQIDIRENKERQYLKMKKLRPENETQEPILQMFYLWNLIDEYYEGIERYQTLKQ